MFLINREVIEGKKGLESKLSICRYDVQHFRLKWHLICTKIVYNIKKKDIDRSTVDNRPPSMGNILNHSLGKNRIR